MAKNAITDYSSTAASNTDIGGINVQGSAAISNADDAFREVASHLADTNAGISPWADTMTIGDAADLTKEVRFELSGITAGQTRVVTMPDASGTLMLSGSNPTLASLEGLTLGAGDMLYATAADTLADLAIGTAGQFLVTNAGATAPEWASKATLVSLEGLTLGAGDILYATAADTLADLAIGTAGQVLRTNTGATAPAWGGCAPDAVLEDQKAQNTAGGTFTSGAWQTRTLNTEVRDAYSLITLSSNEFTPTVAGWVEWSAPAYDCTENQTRLYNVTDTAVVTYGTSKYAGTGSIMDSTGGGAVVAGKAYRIEHRCATTKATNGFGVVANLATEVYTRVKFWTT